MSQRCHDALVSYLVILECPIQAVQRASKASGSIEIGTVEISRTSIAGVG